jgi:DNA-binding MarR family transcriptional regulator
MIDQAESPAGFATISELGRLRGVHKAAISRRVARLEAQGVLQSQRGDRGTKLVNIAEFDRVASALRAHHSRLRDRVDASPRPDNG